MNACGCATTRTGGSAATRSTFTGGHGLGMSTDSASEAVSAPTCRQDEMCQRPLLKGKGQAMRNYTNR